MKKIVAFLFITSLIITGCSKSNEVTLSGNLADSTGSCDTVNMKYSVNIQPIIQANCYSCHGNGGSQGGVNFDSYNKVKQQAGNGLLIGVITHANGYSPMPKGGAKLSDCDINKIRDWIANGSLNN